MPSRTFQAQSALSEALNYIPVLTPTSTQNPNSTSQQQQPNTNTPKPSAPQLPPAPTRRHEGLGVSKAKPSTISCFVLVEGCLAQILTWGRLVDAKKRGNRSTRVATSARVHAYLTDLQSCTSSGARFCLARYAPCRTSRRR